MEWDGRHIVNWRYLIGEGVVRVRVARAGTYRVRFDAMPVGAPVTLTLRGPSGAPVTEALRARRTVDVLMGLPAGTSDVRVSDGLTGPTAQVSPWVLELVP